MPTFWEPPPLASVAAVVGMVGVTYALMFMGDARRDERGDDRDSGQVPRSPSGDGTGVPSPDETDVPDAPRGDGDGSS